MNSRPVYATFRRPITVMNKITERQKEQEIAAELGNSTNAFTNWMAGSLFSYFIRKRVQNDV